MSKNMDLGILIIRLTIGALMLFHGVAKITGGIGGIENMLSSAGLPAFFAYGVFVGEVIAPLFLLAGYRTRIAAGVLAFNCVVALFLAHAGDIFTINKFGGWGVELLGLFLFPAIALIFMGGGNFAFSKDHKWD